MSSSLVTSLRRTRSPLPAIAATIGMTAAAAWFVAARQVAQAESLAQQEAAIEQGAKLVALLRQTASDRARANAQLLAEDTRLKAALSVPELDRRTLLDLLQDLKKLDDQETFAVLSPAGRVRAVLGAPQLEGVDLGTSAAVKSALAQPGAATGAWLVDGRVLELGVAAVRVDETPVGMLAIGLRVSDDALTTAARAARVNLALVVGDKPVWASAKVAEETWTSPRAKSIEVSELARYVVAADAETPEYLVAFAWAVPIGVLLFATLAFWRGGAT